MRGQRIGKTLQKEGRKEGQIHRISCWMDVVRWPSFSKTCFSSPWQYQPISENKFCWIPPSSVLWLTHILSKISWKTTPPPLNLGWWGRNWENLEKIHPLPLGIFRTWEYWFIHRQHHPPHHPHKRLGYFQINLCTRLIDEWLIKVSILYVCVS